MYEVIVAFPRPEDAKSIKNILVQNGISVHSVVTSGTQAISVMNGLDSGILISGYRFRDMYYKDLKDCLPDGFSMILIASAPKLLEVSGDIVCVCLPFKTYDLINTIEMMTQSFRKRRKRTGHKSCVRTEEEKKWIERAKILLMERNNLSEEEAHRYLQRTSMDNGTNMAETAQMVLTLM